MIKDLISFFENIFKPGTDSSLYKPETDSSIQKEEEELAKKKFENYSQNISVATNILKLVTGVWLITDFSTFISKEQKDLSMKQESLDNNRVSKESVDIEESLNNKDSQNNFKSLDKLFFGLAAAGALYFALRNTGPLYNSFCRKDALFNLKDSQADDLDVNYPFPSRLESLKKESVRDSNDSNLFHGCFNKDVSKKHFSENIISNPFLNYNFFKVQKPMNSEVSKVTFSDEELNNRISTMKPERSESKKYLTEEIEATFINKYSY